MKFESFKRMVKASRQDYEKRIHDAWQRGNLEAWTFYRGNKEAYADIENILPKVEQDLTLQELKDFCKIADDGCKTCPFALWDTDEDGERFMYNCDINAPHYCDVEEITQKVREASK